jgi:hypothetical protein
MVPERLVPGGEQLEGKSIGGRTVEWVEDVKEVVRETEKALTGSARRVYLARTVRV